MLLLARRTPPTGGFYLFIFAVEQKKRCYLALGPDGGRRQDRKTSDLLHRSRRKCLKQRHRPVLSSLSSAEEKPFLEAGTCSVSVNGEMKMEAALGADRLHEARLLC